MKNYMYFFWKMKIFINLSKLLKSHIELGRFSGEIFFIAEHRHNTEFYPQIWPESLEERHGSSSRPSVLASVHGQRSLVGYSLQSHKESDIVTEHTHIHINLNMYYVANTLFIEYYVEYIFDNVLFSLTVCHNFSCDYTHLIFVLFHCICTMFNSILLNK